MNARPPSRARRSRAQGRRGIALVMILAFVVLLTVLVVAYFSYTALQRQISHSSVNQTSVDIFARGAVDTLLSDLRMEIAAGSLPMTDAAGNNVPNTYFPRSPETAMPYDQGFTRSFDPTTKLENDGLNNLLKRSAAGAPFYAGANYDTEAYPASTRAASVSTTSRSLNGRLISRSRWNAPLLLPKVDASSPRDLTPVSNFVAPDWVLVSRNGSNPTAWNNALRWDSSNAASVVGRYAYVIYDVGGLLDVNAAGFPPGSADELTWDKGSLAFADLAAIPGLSEESVAALVGWRNYASSQPSGNFPAYVFNDAARQRYFDFARVNALTFKRTANTALFDNRSDSLFVSRQQLIRFLTQGVAGDDVERAQLHEALRYLTTFTRDLEQPSFAPDPERSKTTTHRWSTHDNNAIGVGGNDAYDPSGELQDQINPQVLAVRDPSDPAQPVMKRRFPLSRLSLLRPNPSAADAVEIKRHFGLEWEDAEGRWKYDHGDPNQILKLADIPAGREPDFFETLKAAINCGSLGRQYGGNDSLFSVGGSNVYSPHQFVQGAAAIDGVINFQLIQIGANIIDQYDADSYPTTIVFGTASREFHGVENLPYFAGWRKSWYRMKRLNATDISAAHPIPSGGTNGFPYESWVLYQPILWNPHAPDADLDTARAPTSFRISAGSTTGTGISITQFSRPAWWQDGPASQYPSANTAPALTPVSWSSATLDPNVSLLTFSAAANSAPGLTAAFQEPSRLLYNFPAGTNADVDPAYPEGKISLNHYGSVADSDLAGPDAPTDGLTVIGFYGGRAWTGPWNELIADPGQNIRPNCLSTGYASTNNLQFTLQYQDAAGDWRTYDVINQIYSAGSIESIVATTDNSGVGNQVRAQRGGFRVDPRTNRWGLFNMKTFPTAPAPSGVTTAQTNGIHAAPVYPMPENTTLSPYAGINQGFVYRATRNASGIALEGWPHMNAIPISDLCINTFNGQPASYIPGRKFFYNDPDHVLRRADSAYMRSTTANNSNDGLPYHTGNFASRPVVLNRPFRSVAELGYTFSETPWKSINFLAPESGDSYLLDAFCLHEAETSPEDVSVAGRVNLNTRQPKVLEAVIRGVSKAEGGPVSDQEAQTAAEALVQWTTADPTDAANQMDGIFAKGPLRNRAELVGKYISAVEYDPPAGNNLPDIDYEGARSYSGYSSMLISGANGVFQPPGSQPDGRDAASIKRRRESVIRALADSGNTRTWNLMIDLVAQVGRYPKNASQLSNFMVEGETRWWVHLAIDRSTGAVVARLVEPVSE